MTEARVTPPFDTAQLFDEDYLYFYEDVLTDERSDAEAARILGLLSPEPGAAVLDVPCGHGRIANRLAAAGLRVTGLDATPLFLDRARTDAEARGVTVDYREGDMRALPFGDASFDAAVNWFTSFGYFDDDGNRTVLREACRVLRPGGRLLVETMHRDWMVVNVRPVFTQERDGDWLIDELGEIDMRTGRLATRRTMIRGGHRRTARFFVRLLSFTELRDWLLDAGFTTVEGYGEDGEPLRLDHRRLIVLATA